MTDLVPSEAPSEDGDPADGISHVAATFGSQDPTDLPAVLEQVRLQGLGGAQELVVDPGTAPDERTVVMGSQVDL